MNIPVKLLLRIGILLMAAGSAILGAVLVSTRFPYSESGSSQLAAYGENGNMRYLDVRDYEERILVPMNFTGSFSIYDYEGMRKLWNGLNEPQMVFPVDGPTIVDFKPSYRGFYLLLLRSEYGEMVNLEQSFVAKSGVEPYSLRDSAFVVVSGLAFSLVVGVAWKLTEWRAYRLERLR
ncbi:hypothetical protein MUP37_04115 [Candidatus Bathyarchaeota archaeon]|nr:hypothetical protein [Candidatus Bathyarchaeota archaeon]